MRIQAGSQTSFYYPDVLVVCGDNIRTGDFQDAASVIVEVLSNSTRRIDEGEKLQACTKLASLNAYILLEQDFPAAVVYRRRVNGFQREILNGLDVVIDLPTLNARLPLVAVYAEVIFAAEPES